MPDDKPTLNGLFLDQPDTPEGKYLVTRRDGTDVEWPHFVLGARDRYAYLALLAYAEAAEDGGEGVGFVEGIRRHARRFHLYRLAHGDGDPAKGRHRKDDPATIERMRKCKSA